MKAIGIDIGTTTISVVVLDTEKQMVLDSRTISNGTFLDTGKEWERIQDVEKIVPKVIEVLEELLGQHDDIQTIGLTGQMHGIMYINKEGKCISPLYTWQDGRGNLPDKDGITLTERIAKQTGISVYTGYGLVTHLYQCSIGAVPEEAVAICTIGDYIGMCLTGRKRPLMHASNAASLGFFDVEAGEYQAAVLKKLGMDVSLLPQVCYEYETLGSYQGIPVTVALGDNQASFLGSVGMEEGTLLLNMGTGGQISVLSSQYLAKQGIETRPFTKDKYLLVGASLCGGRAYAILEKFLRNYEKACREKENKNITETFIQEVSPQYEIMEQLARKGMDQKDSMRVTTTFNGTRQEPALRGRIDNLSEDNFTPEGLIYGVLEGMVRELYEMFQIIQENTGIRAVKLVASGNGFRRNAVLQEIAARMFGAKLTLALYQEEAACGAAVSSTFHILP